MLAVLLTLSALYLRPHTGPRWRPDERIKHLPPKTLWVWERSEDLSGIDTTSTAIAWLDQTILIGNRLSVLPRRQSMLYPQAVRRIAVVRIEAQPVAKLKGAADQKLIQEIVGQIMQSARKPDVAALQIDFDATRSQREFYSELLRELRARMPDKLPLSITALASWCSYDDWIADLPVDEAVPMLFRMEPDHRRASPDTAEFRIREPLCTGSIGVSTHERWPADMAGKRIYIFADRGWREDLPYLIGRRLP